MNEMKELLKAIERLQTLYDINHEVMDADDCGDLLSNIQGLKEMYHKVYKKQLIQFIEYLEGSLFETQDDETAWQKWTEQPYTITHGSKSVVIDNYADFYDGLLNLLKEHHKDLI